MIVLIDLDETIVDLLGPWLEAAHTCCPPADRPLSVADIATYHGIEQVPCGGHVYDHLTAGLFRSLRPKPGAIEGVERIVGAGHDVVIVTASAKDPSTAAAKLAWVEEHLGWSRHRVIVAQRKELIRGDVLLDDAPKNLEAYSRAWPDAYLATIAYPYNHGVQGVHRYDGWDRPAEAWAAMAELVVGLGRPR